MTTFSEGSDLPTVEQRATAMGLRQLLQEMSAHGPPPEPAAAAGLRAQVPLLPSGTLRQAVAKGFEVVSSAGLHGTPLRELSAEGQHWHLVASLALDELGRREAQALDGLAAHPPAYLVAAIGRPDPTDRSGGAARGSWLAVTTHVMAYRLQYGISDPTRALGASPTRPMGLARETDWRVVMGEIRWSVGNLGAHLADPAVLGVFDATGRVDPQEAMAALRDEVVRWVWHGDGREQRIRASPSHALRKRVAQALDLLRQRPRECSAELAHWMAVRDATATLYQQELAAGTHRQPGRARDQTDGAHERLSRRLEELDTTIAQVRRAQHERGLWSGERAELLAAGRVAAAELAQREREALLALEENSPSYLVAELGQPAGDVASRTTWRRGAHFIERYRTRHEIDDPDRAFGSSRDARQRARIAVVRERLDLLLEKPDLPGADLPAPPVPSYGRTLGQ